jgi:hypothetical protein
VKLRGSPEELDTTTTGSRRSPTRIVAGVPTVMP